MFVCYCVFNPRIRCLTTANCWPFLSSRIRLICGIKQPFKTAFRCTTLRLGMPWQKRLEENLSLRTKQDAFNGYCRTSTLGRRKSQQALGHQNGSWICWRWSMSHKRSWLKLAPKNNQNPKRWQRLLHLHLHHLVQPNALLSECWQKRILLVQRGLLPARRRTMNIHRKRSGSLTKRALKGFLLVPRLKDLQNFL